MVSEGERVPALRMACPSSLLVVGKEPAASVVRRSIAPSTCVAVMGAKRAEKESGTGGRGLAAGGRRQSVGARFGAGWIAVGGGRRLVKVIVCVEGGTPGEATRGALALATTLNPAATVIALSATASATGGNEALTRAQQLGANRVAHLHDPQLAAGDAHALGFALAEATRQLGVELVLAGIRSDGEGRGIVPAAVAHHLGSYWSGVEAVAVDAKNPKQVTIVVRAGGRKRTLLVSLPAVLAISANAPSETEAADAGVSTAIEKLPLPEGRAESRESARGGLGALDRTRSKPATVSSAADLVQRWRDGKRP